MAQQQGTIESFRRLPKWQQAGIASGLVGATAMAGLYLWARSKTPDVFEDVSFLLRLGKLRRGMESVCKAEEYSIVDDIEATCARVPKKTAIYYVDTGASFTFEELNARANQVAHWALEIGLKKGDTVALLMDNRPEFVITWIGLAKAGVVIALINSNITGAPLLHSLKVSYAKTFIIGAEHAAKATFAKSQFPDTNWYSQGGHVTGLERMDGHVASMSRKNLAPSARSGIDAYSRCMYIYTSGTTGNPKAGVITHRKFSGMSLMFSVIYQIQETDRIYCCLPLYHSAGGVCCVGMSLWTGATLVLRKKFSASNFWNDIRLNKCTVMQYIGELCRYLLAQPPSADDGKSGLRLAIGNGLRGDIWEEFQRRYNIPTIGEFYGATEGNAGLVNMKGKVGAVGYVSPLFECLLPLKIVKFDVVKEEPIRDANGFCIECPEGETGELIIHINPKDITNKFDGYTDEQASKKKVMKDVFQKGDQYFRSGDLMRRERGYYYFMDRIGDTFRWKGENVSTNMVSSVISSVEGVVECNVYGVSVPGHDGRAGMACMVTETGFGLESLYDVVSKDLPRYARPLFLRIKDELEVTQTFKHKKVNLQKEGFNPNVAKDDRFYFRDDEKKAFVPLTQDLFEYLQTPSVKARL